MQKVEEFYEKLSRYVNIFEKLKISGNKILQGMFSGIHKSPYFGFGADFEENRGYNFGDNLKLINWPLWARTEKLFVKKFKETTNSDIIILLDNSLSMGYPEKKPTKFEMAKLIAGILGLIFINQMDRVGFFTISSTPKILTPMRGNEARDIFIRELLKVELDDNVDIEKNLTFFSQNTKRRSIVIIISDFIFQLNSIEKGLNHLIYGHHLVFAINILHELEYNPQFYKGLYYDPENRVNKISINNFSLRDYEMNLKKWQYQINEILLRKEIYGFNISTDTDIVKFIMQLVNGSEKWNF